MTQKRQHICILVLSPIARDARVLRQIEYLAPHYDITVIGYGEAPPEWAGRVAWHNILGGRWSQVFDRILRLIVVAIGRVIPPAYALEYILTTRAHRAKRAVRQTNADAYHANDWDTLPLVVPHVRISGAKLVFDAHEYALEQQPTKLRAFVFHPRAHYSLKRYIHMAHRMITVSARIAERYHAIFGVDAFVVMNAPRYANMEASPVQSDVYNIVSHGTALPQRKIDHIIRLMEHLDHRFHLHLYLVGASNYIAMLKALAQATAPERITFHAPVKPHDITSTINQYDIGIHLLEPINFNHRSALPNKFFDFINARLAICIGPSDGMSDIVREHRIGVIAPSFALDELARTLNALTPDDIMRMKQNASKAAQVLNADVEMQKVVDLYADLLS
jgi:hypothetical protein